ncbi:MATE family efflux transporter [Roseivirga echinicomitans]|uniref:Multidrug-efflux transporter n=1 Tax=Roseivirga echinicomitans TaxID=296218 RepID=A0A150WYK5_9BACT|nr:MATE family efflux transporter [Roseivirga echinicomitans]KYG71568.1 MATE family efflux transporter [Roseivirga echinicomitans]
MKSPRKSLTEGPILKALTMLALPIIGVNLLQTGYQLVDAFWVGRLGANAVAAVSISFPINFLLISISSGFAFAGAILVAQYAGAKNFKMVNHVARQTLLMAFLISLVVSIIAYIFSPQILYAIGVEEIIFDDANLFQRTIFIGLIFNFGFIMFQSLLRGIGEVKIPLYINGATLLLNFFLDPLFIYGWGPIEAYGVTGAAVSTLVTQFISIALGMYILFKGTTEIKLSIKAFSFDWPLLNKAFKLGFPSSIEISARALGLTIMTVLVARFGTEVLAAYGVGSRLISFVVILSLGLSKACTTLVGQNMGAQRIDRAEKTSYYSSVIGFISLSVVGLIFFIFAEPLTRAFLAGDDNVVGMGVDFLKITSLSFGFMGLQMSIIGTLRGSGNTVSSMVLTIIGIWVIQFPVAWYLSSHTSLGYDGLWWSFPISNVIPALITLGWYKTGRWKKKNLVHSNAEG